MFSSVAATAAPVKPVPLPGTNPVDGPENWTEPAVELEVSDNKRALFFGPRYAEVEKIYGGLMDGKTVRTKEQWVEAFNLKKPQLKAALEAQNLFEKVEGDLAAAVERGRIRAIEEGVSLKDPKTAVPQAVMQASDGAFYVASLILEPLNPAVTGGYQLEFSGIYDWQSIDAGLPTSKRNSVSFDNPHPALRAVVGSESVAYFDKK